MIIIFALSQPVTSITLSQGAPSVGQIKVVGRLVVTFIHKETKLLFASQKWLSVVFAMKGKQC